MGDKEGVGEKDKGLALVIIVEEKRGIDAGSVEEEIGVGFDDVRENL